VGEASCEKNSHTRRACGAALFIPIASVDTLSFFSRPWVKWVLYTSKGGSSGLKKSPLAFAVCTVVLRLGSSSAARSGAIMTSCQGCLEERLEILAVGKLRVEFGDVADCCGSVNAQ